VTLHDAAAAYRTAEAAYARARARSVDLRRVGYTRQAREANQASIDARDAFEAARDELVQAALAHDCEAA
jgi:hypothetical protein